MTRVLTYVRMDVDGDVVVRMFHDAPLKFQVCRGFEFWVERRLGVEGVYII